MPKNIHRDLPIKTENEKVIFDNIELLKKLKQNEADDDEKHTMNTDLAQKKKAETVNPVAEKK